jgi:cell division protein FtsI/penicillin-binding protein 2
MAQSSRLAQNSRLHLLSAAFIGIGLVLSARLSIVQVVEHDRYRELARDEHFQVQSVPPRRGTLLDANGNALAITVMYDTLSLVGSEITAPDATAARLAALLELRPEDIRAQIDPTSSRPVTIKGKLPSATSSQIRDLIREQRLDGLYLQPEPVRQYPEGSIAPQVLGFIGRDGEGLAGLEYSYDDELSGTPGQIQSERDSSGKEIALGQRVLVRPQDGAELTLTIDRVVQRIAERSLAEAVVSNKASGGLILVMEPATGAILGMASWPIFSLTDDSLYRPDQESLYKTVQVTNQYEPGSVMKIVTMAAGLEEHLVTPTTTINDTGIVEIGGAVLKNWDLRGNGVITMTEVLIHSSNIGAQHVSGLLGPDRFYRYIDAFGFGKLTGVRLPGEVPGMVRTPADQGWSRVDLATNAFGQGIAVTPLQMLSAISTIANKGVLMKPQIVKASRVDGQLTPQEPEPVRRVVSEQTALTLTDMMVSVLEQPALQANRMPGYRFAGKTGTADFPTNLGYTSGKTYASIVSFGPLPTPRYSVLIRLDAPEGIYGGAVAAPVLKRVNQELLAYYRLPASSPSGTGRP